MKLPESDIKYSGWRGGIGIAFGQPATAIPDSMELGYEVAWGMESHPAETCRAGIASFRYWNSIVETYLKDQSTPPRYDFSGMEDKQKAAELAFEKYAELNYGMKGLSKYATVKYKPDGTYGDVYGAMDLTGNNPLAEAVILSYMKWLNDQKVTNGGVGLDNAGKLPESFLIRLREEVTKHGLGIAANGCPDQFLKYVDIFANEGFPYTVQFSREVLAKGFRGILAEATMQHVSGGELELYLKSRHFNRIMFFAYTNGGVAKSAGNSFYFVRPDVYDHQRWVLRKYVSIARSMVSAGLEETPAAKLVSAEESAQTGAKGPVVQLHDNGKVFEYEWDRHVDIKQMVESSTGGRFIIQHGRDAGKGVYIYVNSLDGERVECDARAMGARANTVAYDEFGEKIIGSSLENDHFVFSTESGPGLVQIGSREAIVRTMLGRIETIFKHDLLQMEMERTAGLRYPLKQWPYFCNGYALVDDHSRTGRYAIQTSGGTYRLARWDHITRMGTAQFVVLDQAMPETLTFSAWSKSNSVDRVDSVDLNILADRKKHFDAREAHSYCIRLYLDYQDGQWPEVHSENFSAGTHDWEQAKITVVPTRPVKTALVMMELQQTKGLAWFDDTELTQGSAPGRNLLAYPGFEKDEALEKNVLEIGKAYEAEAQKLVAALAAMKGSAAHLAKAKKQLNQLEKIISGAGLNAYFGYQIRDCRDAKIRLAKCEKILQ